MIFEVPPKLSDADIRNTLGPEYGRLERLQQIRGIDALGWYVTFHQRACQHGVHIPMEGVATLVLGALLGCDMPLERKFEVAFQAILRHELFHFEADCMAANWELATGTESTGGRGPSTEIRKGTSNSRRLLPMLTYLGDFGIPLGSYLLPMGRRAL